MRGAYRPPSTSHAIDSGGCTIEHRLEVLRAVPFFRHLSLDELQPINDRFQSRAFAGQQAIYTAGTPAERLYVVAHGKVKLVRHTVRGQDVLLDIVGPGELFGSLAALGDREYTDAAQAQSSACVLSIDSADFEMILERSASVALAVLKVVAGRLQEAHEAISQISTMPVEVRVAAALVKLAEKLGVESAEGVLIQSPLSRQDLAAMVGATVESVSRVMSEFRRQGLIAGGRGWVAVRDMATLRETAETQR